MKLTRMLKFKKAKVNEKFYGSNYWDMGSSYDYVPDGTIVRELNKLCEKYNAEIIRITLRDVNKESVIKIKAHRKDFKNLVNDFMIYFIKWIYNVRY